VRHCTFCGDELSAEFYQQVTAWVANAKRDSVTLRADVEPPRFACRPCIRRQQSGVAEDQAALL
jgi:hypothetical protein